MEPNTDFVGFVQSLDWQTILPVILAILVVALIISLIAKALKVAIVIFILVVVIPCAATAFCGEGDDFYEKFTSLLPQRIEEVKQSVTSGELPDFDFNFGDSDRGVFEDTPSMLPEATDGTN